MVEPCCAATGTTYVVFLVRLKMAETCFGLTRAVRKYLLRFLWRRLDNPATCLSLSTSISLITPTTRRLAIARAVGLVLVRSGGSRYGDSSACPAISEDTLARAYISGLSWRRTGKNTAPKLYRARGGRCRYVKRAPDIKRRLREHERLVH